MDSRLAVLQDRYSKNVRKLEFFDANCWLGKPNNPGSLFFTNARGLLEQMDRIGIERAVVSHTLARYSHPLIGNSMVLDEIKGEKRLTGSFVLLPAATRELGPLGDYIERMLSSNVRTVRLFPKSHNYSLRGWTCSGLLKKLEKRRLPLFIWPRETDWDTLFQTADSHPDLPIVLEQCDEEAYWNLRYLLPLMEKCSNVHVETDKGHLYLGLDEIVKRFGAGRVIYGSHLPVDDPNASLMLVTDGDFSAEDGQKIAHGNLDRLMRGVKL
jgi:predicted TIM-barrel fold metal-dependent hydrolase